MGQKKTKSILGIILIIIGAAMLLWSGFAVVAGGARLGMISLTSLEAIVPFIIGLIFFASGIKLVRAT